MVVSFAVTACGSGGGPASKPSPAPTGTPADAQAVRNVDFTQVGAVTTMLRQLGSGEVDVRSILYADLTGDGREEAVVPIASGGTLGNIAYLVFTLRGGTPATVLSRTRDRTTVSGLAVSVEDGKLIETTGEYGPEDPRCCPSALKKTYFRWDGASLQVEREETVTNPNGPKKD